MKTTKEIVNFGYIRRRYTLSNIKYLYSPVFPRGVEKGENQNVKWNHECNLMSLFCFFRIFTALEIFLRALDDDEVAFLAARNCFRTFAFTENWSLFELYLNFFSLVSATTSFSSILSSFLLRDLSSFGTVFCWCRRPRIFYSERKPVVARRAPTVGARGANGA